MGTKHGETQNLKICKMEEFNIANREIKTVEQYENLAAASTKRVQALMLTSPSCNVCNYFKKKGMKKYAEKYAQTADFWWINAESEFGEKTLGRKSMFPMWQFFALGEKQRREEPGTSDFMLSDNLDRYADWIRRENEN